MARLRSRHPGRATATPRSRQQLLEPPYDLVQRMADPPRGPLAFAAVIAASLALAALSYRFLERGLAERVRRALYA
ncbi:MAG: hypothetical protein KIT31_37705 [Deltaproteobacteria bacterium]|nr:hypothetical protein [Deltaproteobacteria bacterium]